MISNLCLLYKDNMEIRQLECFVAAVEHKTFLKASEVLFVTQPAVSKAIAQMEKDIKTKLFERSSKGLKLTPQGENLYQYAKSILYQVELMKNSSAIENGNLLCVASYPSYTIADLISDYYAMNQDIERLDFREGEMQDIIDYVYTGISEVGILYISTSRLEDFEHILDHKHLELIPITQKKLAVYVGKKHSLYQKECKAPLQEEELNSFQYIRGARDFFSVEHHVERTSLMPPGFTGLQDKVVTNSDHLTMLLMDKTDLCWRGIDTATANEGSKYLINSNKNTLILGYIKRKSTILSPLVEGFLDLLAQKI